MVSGPEPHRRLMEQALMAWMKADDEPALLIAGRPGAQPQVDGHITALPDPTAEELAGALKGANTIVCRSGYSSCSTSPHWANAPSSSLRPVNPEQVYLAKHWAVAFGMATCTQKELESGQLPLPAGAAPSSTPTPVRKRRSTNWSLPRNFDRWNNR